MLLFFFKNIYSKCCAGFSSQDAATLTTFSGKYGRCWCDVGVKSRCAWSRCWWSTQQNKPLFPTSSLLNLYEQSGIEHGTDRLVDMGCSWCTITPWCGPVWKPSALRRQKVRRFHWILTLWQMIEAGSWLISGPGQTVSVGEDRENDSSLMKSSCTRQPKHQKNALGQFAVKW